MQLTTILSVAIVLLLSIVIRSVDIFKFYAFGVDTFANLLYAKLLRNGLLNLHKVGKIVYPPFLPRLLYYLQCWFSVRALHVIPKLFDVLTSITVFSFTLWFTGNELIAFFGLLIYTFSPINIVNGYGIGTRSIGAFFFVLTILASYVAVFDAQVRYVMFVLAVFSSLLMMFTSRIAYKTYFLFTIVVFALLLLDNSYGIFLMTSVISPVLCLLATRGRFIDDLRGHFFLINFFRKRKRKGESVLKRIASVFYYDVWWLVGFLAIVNGADLFLGTWLLTVVALSFIWPWGEGERHIALGAAPASILAASYLSQQYLMLVPLLLLETLIIIRFSVRILKGRVLVSVDRPLQNLFNTLKETENEPLFLCLPPIYSAPLAFFAEKKVLYGESSSEEGILFQAEVLDAIKTQDGLEELTQKYSVTHLFVDMHRFPFTASANYWEPMIQQKRFTVLKRKSHYGKKLKLQLTASKEG